MGLRMDFKWTEEDHRRYNVIFSQARLWPAPGPGYFTTDKWKLWANMLTGEKCFVSNGPAGDGFVVYAVTQPDPATWV